MGTKGTTVVTNQRVVFQGAGKTREWLFSKLIDVDHSTGTGSSMLHVSNRQNASGLVYGDEAADDVRFRLDVALAMYSSDIDEICCRTCRAPASQCSTHRSPPCLRHRLLDAPPPPDAVTVPATSSSVTPSRGTALQRGWPPPRP